MDRAELKHTLVIGGSSDIGAAVINHWLDLGWSVAATYRTYSRSVDALASRGVMWQRYLMGWHPQCLPQTPWDILMLCPAYDPPGEFAALEWDDFEHAVAVNFTDIMRVLHYLLPAARPNAMVLTWAGGGVNGAPISKSAYTVSKIALVKMMELLDAEIRACRFVSVGPGWVDTKIHPEGIEHADWTPISDIIEFIDWCIAQPKSIVGGRNFSVRGDCWRDGSNYARFLGQDYEAGKLRRSANDWRPDGPRN